MKQIFQKKEKISIDREKNYRSNDNNRTEKLFLSIDKMDVKVN